MLKIQYIWDDMYWYQPIIQTMILGFLAYASSFKLIKYMVLNTQIVKFQTFDHD